MRVLYIINNLNKGGAERLMVDMLPLFRNSGLEVELLQLSNKQSETEYINILLKENIVCTHLNFSSIYNPFIIFKLLAYVKSSRYDIIHVHLFPSMYWAAMASKLVKNKAHLVFTEHSTQNKRFDKKYLQFFEQWIYNSYDKIVVISEAIRLKLNTWTGLPMKIELIRNGVNINHFSEVQHYDNEYWLNNFSIPSNAVKLMMTARFSYPKDHKTLIKALSLLPPNYYLILTGDGLNRGAVEQYSKELGISSKVHFLGFRTDVASLMKSVDINILSSEYEGMSGVTLEALAAGKPFLGSDVSGINDVVPDSRFLFKPANSNDLARSIQEIILNHDLNKSMIRDALKYAEKFNVHFTIECYKDLYDKTLNEK